MSMFITSNYENYYKNTASNAGNAKRESGQSAQVNTNTSERQLTRQYENYTIDMDRLTQKFQDKDRNSAKSSGYDTVDISADGRWALDCEMLEAIRAGQGINAAGTLTNVSSLRVFEDFEKAVSEENRDKTAVNNFDRHVDKMVSAYRKMRQEIEEKYANMSQEQQEQSFYIADDKSIQQLTKEKELELLDKAYEQHSSAIAHFTEILRDLQDFKPQPASSDSVKPKKGEIRDQAYRIFMSAINKGDFQSDSGSAAVSKSELNRIWDYYAGL